jgi:hypothetical protein
MRPAAKPCLANLSNLPATRNHLTTCLTKLSNPAPTYCLTGINLETGLPQPCSDGFWRNVVAQLHLTPAQVGPAALKLRRVGYTAAPGRAAWLLWSPQGPPPLGAGGGQQSGVKRSAGERCKALGLAPRGRRAPPTAGNRHPPAPQIQDFLAIHELYAYHATRVLAERAVLQMRLGSAGPGASASITHML